MKLKFVHELRLSSEGACPPLLAIVGSITELLLNSGTDASVLIIY